MKRLPPLPALHTFVITAQCCNFTRAAELLHITQGAVSRQIAGLESHLGYPLFQRQARGLSLTAQGRELFPQIQQAFGLIDEAVERVGARREALRLKAPTCVMRWLLPRLMHWQVERPDVPVELTTTVQHSVDFRSEEFDAAVVFGAQPAQAVVAHHLFDELLTPVCSQQLLTGPLPLKRPADLERHTLLHPTRDQRDWEAWLKAADTKVASIGKGQHFDTLDLAMSVASQGLGVAIGDWSLIGEDLTAGRLATPFELKVRTGDAYFLVYPERPQPSTQLTELVDWLRQQAAARTVQLPR